MALNKLKALKLIQILNQSIKNPETSLKYRNQFTLLTSVVLSAQCTDTNVNNVVTGTDVQTACNTYTWIDGITYNASTNTPTFTIVGGSVSGCDSVVTLDLTINNVVTGIDVQTAIASYTWIDGITYNSSTNTPTFTIVGGSSTGCDSIVL